MRAVILAGGKGTRLAPYTVTFPKPLVPVGDMPILEIVVRQLAAAGFDHVTLAVGHLAELIEAYFGDGRRWGLRIDYSREERPLGTVGPLALIDDLPEHFLVMNGDVLTTLSYRQLYDTHVTSGADMTIACHRLNVRIEYGLIEFDGRLRVTGYREKPAFPGDVSMGVYVLSRPALDFVPKDEYVDIPTLVDRLIAAGREVRASLSDARWLDIGIKEDYAKANEIFEELRHEFLPDPGAST
ncbi:MAG TPA: nucleotidyltransferase family protein [Actinobacteria bacterium]|nr:nucleotidyltransferase family protein [Actinomycetota bacterium]